MQHLFEEIHSNPELIFQKNRSNSYQTNVNISDKISSDNFLIPFENIKIDNYILSKKLGQGTFGIVVLAIHELTGEKVAIKILDKEKIFKNSEKQRFERKIQIMKKMFHNNIVHLYNVIENFKEIFLVMEYIQGQELFDYITNKKRLNEIESCKFYQQIISGIEYLSKTKVAHRDLKPENLLIDLNKTIKIVDFGLSNTYYENELLSTACGSPSYAAPEILQGKNYRGIDVDIWSSGIILYAMLCGYLPFEDDNDQNLYKKIIKGDFITPSFLSHEAVDFLHRILNVDPNKRLNIEQIKSHPWFNMINPQINMSEGLLIDKYIIPFDEEIIKEMVEKYFFSEQIVKINLIINKHNHITSTYYLMLRKKIREGKETIGDMNSKLFLNYIRDPNNLLAKYNFEMNKVIADIIFNTGNEDNNFFSKDNNQNQNIELNIFETNNRKKPNIKLTDDMISNISKKQNYKKQDSKIVENIYIKINNKNSKKHQVFETEKNISVKKLKLKKINVNSKDKRNYISFRDEKSLSKNTKKFKHYFVKQNALSQKYFNSTYSENNQRNINHTNNDIFIDNINEKKLENKINFLKESILKNINQNIINNIQKTENNISLKSKKYNFNPILKTENKGFLRNKNKSEYKNFDKHEVRRNIKRRNKEKNNEIIFSDENKNDKNFSRVNFTKKKFCVNSDSRLSRTPNNILRNLNNQLILEQDIKNDFYRKRYYINEEKNINNYVTNNNNNINININFTNIIKKENEKNENKDENFLTQNKEKIITDYKGVNKLFRLNKFLDNSIKKKNYFINTSVNMEKKRREAESENNRNLFLYSNNNNKNLYDKYNRYNSKKENSVKKKIKDNLYLRIKAKNKKFHNSKIKKLNISNNPKDCINFKDSLNLNQFNKTRKDLKKGKNSNILFNSKNNRCINIEYINNQNLSKSKNNINYIKINYSKNSINDNNKRQNFKHLNTDSNINFNNKNNIYLTNINFFINKRNNLINLKEIKENNINNKISKISSTNIKNDLKNNYLNPFDLNSIIINTDRKDIKKEIFNFLDKKNIKSKNGGNNKFICSKNDMEFELRIINGNCGHDKKIYVIKTFHKVFKSVKTKDLYFKLISKLINKFK